MSGSIGPFFCDEHPVSPMFAIEEFAGVTLDAPVPQLAIATREAALFVNELHDATRVDAVLDSGRIAALVDPALENAISRYPPLAEVLRAARRRIEAELTGTILAKHVENGRPVEYGESLFTIHPI